MGTRATRPKWEGDSCRPHKAELIVAMKHFGVKIAKFTTLDAKQLLAAMRMHKDWQDIVDWIWLRRHLGHKLCRSKPMTKLVRVMVKRDPDALWNVGYE